MKLKIGNLHEEDITFLVLEGPTVDIILGRPWLILHSPEIKWPPGRGLGCWFSLLLRGPGWSSCPRAGAKGVQLRDRALTTPYGVVVPGSRSIECIWGV